MENQFANIELMGSEIPNLLIKHLYQTSQKILLLVMGRQIQKNICPEEEIDFDYQE